MNCTRTLVSEHGVLAATFDCLNCGAEGDLRSPVCYSNVVKAFVEEVQIDSVVLADLNHRQYSGGLVDLLRAQATLIRGFERAALRAGAAAHVKGSKCASCPALPAKVFMPGIEAARTTSGDATRAAEELAAGIAAAPVPESHDECATCVAQTVDVANHLASGSRDSRALLRRIAFNVSEESA